MWLELDAFLFSEGADNETVRGGAMLIKRITGLDGFGTALCKCGHLACDHSSQLTPLDADHSFREYHHGGCCECSCGQFTFHRYVSLEEAARLLLDRQACGATG